MSLPELMLRLRLRLRVLRDSDRCSWRCLRVRLPLLCPRRRLRRRRGDWLSSPSVSSELSDRAENLTRYQCASLAFILIDSEPFCIEL